MMNKWFLFVPILVLLGICVYLRDYKACIIRSLIPITVNDNRHCFYCDQLGEEFPEESENLVTLSFCEEHLSNYIADIPCLDYVKDLE